MWRATADKDQARIIRRRLCNSETQHNQVLRSPIAIMLPSEQNLLLFNMCHRLNKDCKARFIRMVEQYGEQQWQAIKSYRMYDLRREYVNQLFRVQWEDRKRGSCNADQYIHNLPDEAFSRTPMGGMRSASCCMGIQVQIRARDPTIKPHICQISGTDWGHAKVSNTGGL